MRPPAGRRDPPAWSTRRPRLTRSTRPPTHVWTSRPVTDCPTRRQLKNDSRSKDPYPHEHITCVQPFPSGQVPCLWLIDSRQLGHRAWPPDRAVPSPCERLDRPAGRIIIVVRYTFPPLGASGGHRLRWPLESTESQRQRRQHEETQRRRCDESAQDHHRQRPFDLAARCAAA